MTYTGEECLRGTHVCREAHAYGSWEARGSQGDVGRQRAPWHKGEMKDLISHMKRGGLPVTWEGTETSHDTCIGGCR